jgi:hypothetical protein
VKRQLGRKNTTTLTTVRTLEVLFDGVSGSSDFGERMRQFQLFCDVVATQDEFARDWLDKLDLRTYQRYLKDGPPTRPQDLRLFVNRLKRAIRRAGLQGEEEAALVWLLDGIRKKKASVAPEGTTEAVASIAFPEASLTSPFNPGLLQATAIGALVERIQREVWLKLTWPEHKFWRKSPAKTIKALRVCGSTELAEQWNQLANRDDETNADTWRRRYERIHLYKSLNPHWLKASGGTE